jgi:hypothetical protein
MNTEDTPKDSARRFTVTPVTVGSILLFVSFFLPWLSFLGRRMAGYELHRAWSVGPFLFVLPLLAAISIAIGVTGRPDRLIGRITGALVFVFLGIALCQYGWDPIKALVIGGWMTLISALILLVYPNGMKIESVT